MRWSLLILTQPTRKPLLERLLAVLRPQIESRGEDIELLIHQFDPALSLGGNRQRMLAAASGEYVNFIDDDDMVPGHYVEKIFPLLDGVDYIGFRMQLYVDGQARKPTYHSLRYRRWGEDHRAYYRDISHLNPIRRELALLVPFDGPRGEDFRWAEALRKTGKVKTEHFIEDVMYHYYFVRHKPKG